MIKAVGGREGAQGRSLGDFNIKQIGVTSKGDYKAAE